MEKKNKEQKDEVDAAYLKTKKNLKIWKNSLSVYLSFNSRSAKNEASYSTSNSTSNHI